METNFFNKNTAIKKYLSGRNSFFINHVANKN